MRARSSPTRILAVFVLLSGMVLLAILPAATATASARAAHTTADRCSKGHRPATIDGQHRCLRAGQFCALRHDDAYHRYGFHCHRPDSGRARLTAPAPFANLHEAAERGAIDRELAQTLETGATVEALAVLDAAGVVPQLGQGTPGRVANTRSAITRLRREVADDTGVKILQTYEVIPIMLVRIGSPARAVALLNSAEVLSLTADQRHVRWLSSTLPRISQPPVNAMGLIGQGVGIAVLDTGVDFTRTAFGPCTAPGQPATAGGVCRVAVSFDTAKDDGSRDDNGHGTNVAGIVSGVAPGAQIVAIDVFDGDGAHSHDVLEAFDWVLRNRIKYNIRAVNMSFGTPNDFHTGPCDGGFWGRHPYVNSFIGMRSGRVVPVVAAGNHATDEAGTFHDGVASPACLGFAVGATNDSDTIRSFSQDSPGLGVLAPGESVSAAGQTMSGTSQAAPHVAGAVAALASLRPELNTQQLESFVRTSATSITDTRTSRTHPRLDLLTAVRAAYPIPNDDRAAATAITAWGTHIVQPTWTATKEAGEPAHAGNPGGASVWFKWTASQSGTAMINTFGSTYDTLLAVYRAGADGQLTTIAAADDVLGAKTSAVQFPVSPGDIAWIAVDGKAGPPAAPFPGSGHLSLMVNLPNDNLGDAVSIAPGAPGSGANVGASREAGEPRHCGDTHSSASVWYRWKPASDAIASVAATDTSFLLCVAAYRSASHTPTPSELTVVGAASNDQGDPPEFNFAASAGRTYWIAVDGVSQEAACHPVTGQCFYSTQTGGFKLSLTTAPTG